MGYCIREKDQCVHIVVCKFIRDMSGLEEKVSDMNSDLPAFSPLKVQVICKQYFNAPRN